VKKLAFAIALLALVSFGLADGQHDGEKKCLDYSITYVGMTAPFQNYAYLTPQYPGLDYAHVAGYYLGTPMQYNVELTNTCKRTFNHLRLVGIQYYYNAGLLPGQDFTDATPWYNGPDQTFFVDTLKAGQTATFHGIYVPPYTALPGLDMTRLIIAHWESGNPATVDWSDGRKIIDDPHANIWCPPA